MEMRVGCELTYRLEEACGFILQIEAAKADGQIVKSEELILPIGARADIYADPVSLTRVLRTTLGPGPVSVKYSAVVDVDQTAFDPSEVAEYDFSRLPMEYLAYIAPSRYCPSDTFTQFAHQQFGALPKGHRRVTSISDWIQANIRYQAGSTGPTSTAADVFHSRVGVCRDFAHLGISLCRALGIPARYASVYAEGLSPQDFHAVFQAYLIGPRGGAWYTFDASHMSSSDALVRIAAGQDAADVAFAWPQGEVDYDPPKVWADSPTRANTDRTALAVPGA